MATTSKFATAERYKMLQEALDKIDEGIKEAQIAEKAGIQGASTTLQTAEETKQRLIQIKNTYFPNGAVAPPQ